MSIVVVSWTLAQEIQAQGKQNDCTSRVCLCTVSHGESISGRTRARPYSDRPRACMPRVSSREYQVLVLAIVVYITIMTIWSVGHIGMENLEVLKVFKL